ncbi:pyrroline-5-carboxylate reductase-like isoform X1 [Euphorbia lathyris]|uniref:pyrroline-5-carboxylate reductase-like isoform X1 n=1 Tax=Euphorbia lathyris TaxID=212925 RepID=UPI003313C1C6
MAESIARGVVQSGVLPPSRIRTAHSYPDRCSAFESFCVKVFPHNNEVVEDSDVIVFSVKPQVVMLACHNLMVKMSGSRIYPVDVLGIQQEHDTKEMSVKAAHTEELKRTQLIAENEMREKTMQLRNEHDVQMKALRTEHEDECNRLQEELNLQKTKCCWCLVPKRRLRKNITWPPSKIKKLLD